MPDTGNEIVRLHISLPKQTLKKIACYAAEQHRGVISHAIRDLASQALEHHEQTMVERAALRMFRAMQHPVDLETSSCDATRRADPMEAEAV